jgi:hypothetical protein
MPVSIRRQTLVVPRRPGIAADRVTPVLPPDLLNRAATRLQILAWLNAFTFFMAAFFLPLLNPDEREILFERPVNWVPGAAAIAVAVSVAAAIRTGSLQPAMLTLLALMFEVASSYGIAAAEFLQPTGLTADSSWVGLSWVSVWVLLFAVLVPTRPAYAAVAALLAVSAVPLMMLLSLSMFPPTSRPDTLMIFRAFGFPYLLVVFWAYVGARVVHNLGTEVTRARELGSYQLEDQLGAGGMGEVWRASHRLLARPAAIKLIRSAIPGSAITSDEARRRFEREAQVIAQLQSPHTVTLFDFGVVDDGSCYYVMELLDGIDADTLIKRFGPIPPERVVYILRQVCHSLSEAESRGLVHRDIKPANIFLCRYGEDLDFVKVLDFGLAKIVYGTSWQTQPAITMPNVIHGTPAFISPEQAMGGADVDARADIYSTGCVAYWLLTGQLVFPAETPMKLLLAHVNNLPEPPSSRAEIPIPPELDALVLSCLAKNREQRPKSARELLLRLDAVKFDQQWSDKRALEWWTMNFPVERTEGIRGART